MPDTNGTILPSVPSGFGSGGGTQVVEHRHTITAEGARNAAAAGFDTDRLVQLLRADAGGSRYRWAG